MPIGPGGRVPALAQGVPGDSPEAYVWRIVLHTHLATQRRRSAGERPGTDVDGHPVGGNMVADHADAIVERESARRALNDLPPRARAVLVLRYYADLDDVAIGDLLGLAPSSVRAVASRALAQLRQQVAPRSAGSRDRT